MNSMWFQAFLKIKLGVPKNGWYWKSHQKRIHHHREAPTEAAPEGATGWGLRVRGVGSWGGWSLSFLPGFVFL